MEKKLELYIHIPFCVRKCLYCDFVSFAGKEDQYDEYVNALCREIETVSEQYRQYSVASVFIGGGTPSVLSESQISKLVRTLYRCFEINNTREKRKGLFRNKIIKPEVEFTIECNPGTIDSSKLRTYKKLGINRLSIGLQSTDEHDLKNLGRIHTYDDFERNFDAARSAGFDNINIDLMQAVPGQNLTGWKRVLAAAAAWKPEHISAYSLIIEEGTAFKDMYDKGLLDLADEDEEREIYHYTKEFLEKSGYKRYEISNYALDGYECFHNKGYWTRQNYLGLGLNSSSMVDNIRWKNTADLKKYLEADDINNIREEYEELTVKAQMEEYVFLGLRLMEGISKTKFINIFHQDFDYTFGNKIRKYSDMGLLEDNGDTVRFTDAGIDVSNSILSDMLLD